MTLRNEVLGSLLEQYQRQLKNTEVPKKVLDEDLEKEVVRPKKAKEGCCGGAA